jgi:hypothetical protein
LCHFLFFSPQDLNPKRYINFDRLEEQLEEFEEDLEKRRRLGQLVPGEY